MDYKSQAARAQDLLDRTGDEYWRGYLAGLHRAHFGLGFGDTDEHAAMRAKSGRLGEGYRDGFSFMASAAS